MSELQKMVNGQDYHINDPELVEIRYVTRERVDEYNATGPRDIGPRRDILGKLFAGMGDNVHIEKPLRVDYGINTRLGSNVFINFNFVILDCAPVTIGSNVFIAPNVQIYTARHPMDATERSNHIGSASPVIIGNDVWIGGNCIILPGVTIGDNCVIGAGSVVTQDIPPNRVAYGNPCRVRRNPSAAAVSA